jgi:signal transduction histidine kinase
MGYTRDLETFGEHLLPHLSLFINALFSEEFHLNRPSLTPQLSGFLISPYSINSSFQTIFLSLVILSRCQFQLLLAWTGYPIDYLTMLVRWVAHLETFFSNAFNNDNEPDTR